ncbi:ATP-binding protein [Oceanisphaera sp. W20_SRM_FM3]|uniref:sensor histidine kinase n=1 Tax=Oceanisphaera sp. W20_SRM_FM3 TaxID=3240267 RepID=UPI003F97985D
MPLILGQDIAYKVLVDDNGELLPEQAAQTLHSLPAHQLGTFSRGYIRKTFWLGFELSKADFGQQERWLELGPNFIDDIKVFYRPLGTTQSWETKHTGDLLQSRSDLDYRNPVFVLPPPSTAGYEMMIRVQTTSTVLLQASFWAPREFLNTATRSTHFWSFYFGLAAISSLLALVLALVLKSRLLWAATAFSSTYLLVASIQGYLNWLLPDWGLPLQHYLTGALTLTSYALLLWLCTETINLKKNQPWLHNILQASCVLILSLVLLLPFGLYPVAVKIQTLVYLVAATLFIGGVFYLWQKNRFHLPILIASASPLTCILASLFGLFSVLGWIPFRSEIYLVWQYALIVNMLFVMALAIFRVREKRLEDLEKKQLAHELQTEREASFHQRQFIGMVSHEFRTPLAVITGSLTNLYHLETAAEPSRLSRYDKIQRATERMIQLTDNCLADARLSADSLYLDLDPINLLELLHSMLPLFEISEPHQLTFTAQDHTASGEPAHYGLIADATLLRIALSNVIDNALKYAPCGTIHVDCSQQAEKVIITVCDQGPGIGNLTGTEIFDRYRQGAQAAQGAGLGLYVARQIIQAHHGELSLASSSAQGSCFKFILPLAKEG